MPTRLADAADRIEIGEPARGDARLSWTDVRLVRDCLNGDEQGWSALIEKYKKLIFSIPVKYGFSSDDASDIFQAVCLELMSELPKLRKPEALPKWIMKVTAHKCFHRKREQQRLVSDPNGDLDLMETPPNYADAILQEAEQEQRLRQAMSELPARCRQLIHVLFFEEPPRPYQQVAETLGLATGSIGFIRQRCLERLRKRLLEIGVS